jgi:hypothetical protein
MVAGGHATETPPSPAMKSRRRLRHCLISQLGIASSMNRFVLRCFAAFLCLSILCKGRPWLAIVLFGIFAALLVQTSALFSHGYWAGLPPRAQSSAAR